MFVVLLSFLLAYSVSARPPTLGSLQARAQVLSPPNTALKQSSLSSTSGPLGPPEFIVTFEPLGTPLGRDECFGMAIVMLSHFASMPSSHDQGPISASWSDSQNFPGIWISVASLHPRPSLWRDSVLWGMARAMDQMVRENRFRAGKFKLYWLGRSVGSLHIDSRRTVQSGGDYAGANFTATGTEVRNTTGTSIDVNNLSWNFESTGQDLTEVHACMGAIGALIKAAQMGRYNKIQFFEGSFPGYKATYVFFASYWPTVIDRAMILDSIAAAAVVMIKQRNFRELKIKVILNQQEVAQGTVAHLDNPGLTAGDSSNVTIS